MKVLGSLRMRLGRRDWVYLLSLLVPFAVYNLALKALMLSSHTMTFMKDVYAYDLIYTMRSDAFFILAYISLWVGLFAAARKGPLRWIVVFLFHTTAILVVIVKTCAYVYFRVTGTTLDYTLISLWLPRVDEIEPMLVQGVSSSDWVLLGVALSWAALGPWLVVCFVRRWRGWPGSLPWVGRPKKIVFLSSLVPCLLALGLGSLSLEGGQDHPGVNRVLMRDPFVNVMVSAAEEVQSRESMDAAAATAPENLTPASLVPTTDSERRNVVLIFLESTRPQSVTPYNENLKTTPFLDELAKNSLLAEQAYTTVPYTSKAMVGTHCGIFPHPVQLASGLVPEANPGGIPTRCLPDLLKDQGYSSAFFMASGQSFEDWGDLMNNFGYDQLNSLSAIRKSVRDNCERVSLNGCDEDTMLEPSEEWLTKQKELGRPFLATYLTVTTHYPYKLPESYEEERFAEDEDLNRYLNALRHQDLFLESLFDQYKELGLYEDTIFVILGDHGEAFGEHGFYGHGNSLYEESLRIPILIHDPKRFENGARVTAPVNQLDILPTIADLLGYKIDGGAYQGSSMLGELPEDRTLHFSCQMAERCLASLRGSEKYIYNYGDQPDEIYDLSEDPPEQKNLADERQKEVEQRRSELLAWRSRTDAIYRGPQESQGE